MFQNKFLHAPLSVDVWFVCLRICNWYLIYWIWAAVFQGVRVSKYVWRQTQWPQNNCVVGMKGCSFRTVILSFPLDSELLLRPDVVFAVNASPDNFFSLTWMRNINVCMCISFWLLKCSLRRRWRSAPVPGWCPAACPASTEGPAPDIQLCTNKST